MKKQSLYKPYISVLDTKMYILVSRWHKKMIEKYKKQRQSLSDFVRKAIEEKIQKEKQRQTIKKGDMEKLIHFVTTPSKEEKEFSSSGKVDTWLYDFRKDRPTTLQLADGKLST